jgi:DNA-binding CsgD family transcriptional regulator
MEESALGRPVALLEREQEVEHVRAVLRAAGRRNGQVLHIEGAAGMGKSRLLQEARSVASQNGLRVLSARATDLDQGFPFGVMRQLFERLLSEADEDDRERWLSGAAALAEDVLIGAPATGSSGVGAASTGGSSYAWRHGLYWLAANVSADAPLALVVDDLQWCDAPSAGALAFIAPRLDGLPLALIVASRPLDPAVTPEAATLLAEPTVDRLHPSPLTEAAVRTLIAARLADDPDPLFVTACLEATGGNPFLVGELLDEAAARALEPTAAAAEDVATIVPQGVANTVLLRLARLASTGAPALAGALSVLGDGTQVGDAARLAGLADGGLESAMAELISAGVVESGGTTRFVHPILRAAVYGDLSPAQRARLHHTAARILRERGAPPGQVAAQLMYTEPAADQEAVGLLRDAAAGALALGDAVGAAALLARALAEPPAPGLRGHVLLELGQARARAGSPDAVGPLSEIVEGEADAGSVAGAAIELSGMLFFAGRVAEGAAILRRALERVAVGDPAREDVRVALLGVSSTSASARREAVATIGALRDPGGPAGDVPQATTLATLAMEELLNLRSASTTRDLALRAIAAGLPAEPHRGENWALLALGALAVADGLDEARQGADDILRQARKRGAALTVVTVSALRALICLRRGELIAAQSDAQAAIELAPSLLGARFLVFAVSAAVLAGLERDETPASLRRLIDDVGVWYDSDFTSSSQLRYASGVLRAAAGRHEAAIEELCGCGREDRAFGGENPAMLAWRSAAAFSMVELGRLEEARDLAADEVRRAESFGAPRALGMALRAQALVGPRAEREGLLERALAVLAPSPARLEHARVLADLGATLRATGRRTAAREPLLEALALAARCGAKALERRVRAELAAIGVRPRTTDHAGPDSLTPSERRVVELAAGGDTNRDIAQMLFVTEKTVETHLGRAFRKLDVSSRRQLADVLAGAQA